MIEPENILNSSAHLLALKISAGELTSKYVYEILANRISKINPKINAYLTTLPYPEEIQSGPLQGIPIAVKDNFHVQGVVCTAGSKILSESEPSKFDSTAVSKLKQSGAVISGTTNLHEFASGVTNNNPFFGPCRNPWDLTRIPGGSSGGSAAAVSARIAFGALGSDTSGSVRIPAALCGLIGLKPTFGRVSAYGVIPLATSLDHVGILSRSALDAAIILREISGYDPLDESSSLTPVEDYSKTLREPIKGMKIGVPNTYFLEEVDQEILDSFEAFCQKLVALGAMVKDVSIDHLESIREVWAPIRMSEAAAYHKNWFKTRPNDYGKDVLEMIKKGMGYSAVEYITALRHKKTLTNSFETVLEEVSALITPTVGVVAPRVGEAQVKVNNLTKDVYSTLGRLTLPFNVTGLPAIAIPIGLSREGLPISAQIASSAFKESIILQIAHNYESTYGSLPPPPLLRS